MSYFPDTPDSDWRGSSSNRQNRSDNYALTPLGITPQGMTPLGITPRGSVFDSPSEDWGGSSSNRHQQIHHPIAIPGDRDWIPQSTLDVYSPEEYTAMLARVHLLERLFGQMRFHFHGAPSQETNDFFRFKDNPKDEIREHLRWNEGDRILLLMDLTNEDVEENPEIFVYGVKSYVHEQQMTRETYMIHMMVTQTRKTRSDKEYTHFTHIYGTPYIMARAISMFKFHVPNLPPQHRIAGAFRYQKFLSFTDDPYNFWIEVSDELAELMRSREAERVRDLALSARFPLRETRCPTNRRR